MDHIAYQLIPERPFNSTGNSLTPESFKFSSFGPRIFPSATIQWWYKTGL